MAFGFRDLWRWDGKVKRKTYALVGLIGFAIKHNVDRFVASRFFYSVKTTGLFTYFFNYWTPLGTAARLTHLSTAEAKFLATMLLVSLPFVWVGVAMTVRRLRDAGQPVWLVILFFAPFVNLLFFAALCGLPSHQKPATQEATPWPRVRPLDGIIPRSATGSAVLSVVLTTAMGVLFVLTGANIIGSYGWSLFVALPFCLGLFAVLLHSYHGRRDLASCMLVALLPVSILGLTLIAIAVEGILCVLMAAPLAFPLAVLGGYLGYIVQDGYWSFKSPGMLTVLFLVVPAGFGMERAVRPEPETFVVQTAVEVNAPPETVWRQVIAFAEIPAPKEVLFRAGIAYPIRAEISGHGAGAVRRCVFSTGSFVEPIEIWDEPRLLKFGVTSNPAPLNELSPYGHIDAPHLRGYFVSRGGQFLLTALPSGGTRLEGTTWYQHTMWPAAYWRLWSDYIIHKIHLRVLKHIRESVASLTH